MNHPDHKIHIKQSQLDLSSMEIITPDRSKLFLHFPQDASSTFSGQPWRRAVGGSASSRCPPREAEPRVALCLRPLVPGEFPDRVRVQTVGEPYSL